MTSVLVVDDTPGDRELLASILGRAGYEVLEADTGEQALALAHAHGPALIFADILTPTMDGYELVRALRDHEATAGIPVIFCTATFVFEEVRRLAAACGVSHVVVKPCHREEVLRLLYEVTGQRADRVTRLPSEDFHRQHLRLVNVKLLEKVEELRETVILAGTLQRESNHGDSEDPLAIASRRPKLESVLTARELQVLGMIVDGATNNEIAGRLVIATSTVQSHVKRILSKLGAKNRTDAAVQYVRR